MQIGEGPLEATSEVGSLIWYQQGDSFGGDLGGSGCIRELSRQLGFAPVGVSSIIMLRNIVCKEQLLPGSSF